MKSGYERASCEYQMRSGQRAQSAAAKSAARREKSWRPIRKAIATVPVPRMADSERNAISPVPKSFAQPQARV